MQRIQYADLRVELFNILIDTVIFSDAESDGNRTYGSITSKGAIHQEINGASDNQNRTAISHLPLDREYEGCHNQGPDEPQ